MITEQEMMPKSIEQSIDEAMDTSYKNGIAYGKLASEVLILRIFNLWDNDTQGRLTADHLLHEFLKQNK